MIFTCGICVSLRERGFIGLLVFLFVIFLISPKVFLDWYWSLFLKGRFFGRIFWLLCCLYLSRFSDEEFVLNFLRIG